MFLNSSPVFQGPLVPEATPRSEDYDEKEKDSAPQSLRPPPEPLLIGSCSGFIETTLKIKQNDMLPGPKVWLLLGICVTSRISACSFYKVENVFNFWLTSN